MQPPAAGDDVRQDDQLVIPYFFADDYKNKATKVYTGDKTFNGGDELMLGTYDHPAIVYISGNLYLKNNSSVRGYGTLIVKGKVSIGDCNFRTQVQGAFCVFSEDDIDIDGDPGHGRGECHGHFFSKKHLHLHDVNLHGTVASGTDMEIDDNSTVQYKPAPATDAIKGTVGFTATPNNTGRLVLYRHYE